MAHLQEPFGVDRSDQGDAPGAVEPVGGQAGGGQPVAQGGDVEDASDFGASALDHAFAAEGAAVASEGGEADEAGDLLGVEGAEFGKIGDEGGGEDGTDALEAGEDAGEGSEVRGVAEGVSDLGGEVVAVLAEAVEMELGASAQLRVCDAPALLGALGALVEDLLPVGEEFGEADALRLGERRGPRPGGLTEGGDGVGIDAVGLGEASEAFGEVADALGVDDGDGMAGAGQGLMGGPFVAVGGFDDDADRGRVAERGQAGPDAVEAGVVVGFAPVLPAGAGRRRARLWRCPVRGCRVRWS